MVNVCLKSSKLLCKFRSSYQGDETLLESLFPNNHDFQELRMERYAGTKLPSWVSAIATFLPGLVSIELSVSLTFCMKGGVVQSPVPSTITASSSLSSNVSVAYTLQRLTIDNSWVFNSLFREFVGGAVCIKLLRMNILGFTKEGFQSCTSSFRDLVIFNCSGLENLAAIGIEQFTNLKSLEFSACDENLEGMPWKFLHSLLFLTISCHPELVNLPKGLQHLTSLQSLRLLS
ncbi:hypothetical protein SOVF_140100 [Spinacia oleracea]|nr:hypothetical protein SOVF_140100 [Spinacia oleracea]